MLQDPTSRNTLHQVAAAQPLHGRPPAERSAGEKVPFPLKRHTQLHSTTACGIHQVAAQSPCGCPSPLVQHRQESTPPMEHSSPQVPPRGGSAPAWVPFSPSAQQLIQSPAEHRGPAYGGQPTCPVEMPCPHKQSKSYRATADSASKGRAALPTTYSRPSRIRNHSS